MLKLNSMLMLVTSLLMLTPALAAESVDAGAEFATYIDPLKEVANPDGICSPSSQSGQIA